MSVSTVKPTWSFSSRVWLLPTGLSLMNTCFTIIIVTAVENIRRSVNARTADRKRSTTPRFRIRWTSGYVLWKTAENIRISLFQTWRRFMQLKRGKKGKINFQFWFISPDNRRLRRCSPEFHSYPAAGLPWTNYPGHSQPGSTSIPWTRWLSRNSAVSLIQWDSSGSGNQCTPVARDSSGGMKLYNVGQPKRLSGKTMNCRSCAAAAPADWILFAARSLAASFFELTQTGSGRPVEKSPVLTLMKSHPLTIYKKKEWREFCIGHNKNECWLIVFWIASPAMRGEESILQISTSTWGGGPAATLTNLQRLRVPVRILTFLGQDMFSVFGANELSRFGSNTIISTVAGVYP